MEDVNFHTEEIVPLERIVKEEYRTYQIYTLMDRAIPYLQDGLKPVQRRILYTLWKNQSKGLMKVSSATGLVLTVHPHGPASIESSIVNLAQDYTFSNNYPLIAKKGYFGERMETMPAASRYIECKLGKIAGILLFDDIKQVEMIPNYDEKVFEPAALFPKLPIMLLNGAEGIGTGFSSTIPSFHHSDLIKSMINFIEKGKAKKLKPFVNNYTGTIETDERKRYLFKMSFKEEKDKFYINELPKGFDAKRIYRHLNKFIDNGYLKDYIDSSVNNDIMIELIFKRGATPTFKDIVKTISVTTSLVPNYTLISERGVRIFKKAEDIIEIFAAKRLEVVKTRYEILAKECAQRILQNKEIIRFIKEKHYTKAEKKQNRKAFVEYLDQKKFKTSEYLVDMAIYRMTKEELAKRVMFVKDDSKLLKEYKKIAASKRLIKKMLILELNEVDKALSDILKAEVKEKAKLAKEAMKKAAKRSKALKK